MVSIRPFLALVLLVGLTWARPSVADTSATVRMTSQGGPRGESMTMDGRWLLKGKRVRSEMQTPMGRLVTIVDSDAKKVFSIQEATKTYTEQDIDKAASGDADLAACSAASDASACLVARGFKKTGTGEANGYACEIFERVATDDGRHTQTKIWKPQAKKPLPFVRLEFAGSGANGRMDVTEIKEGPLDDALFKVPAGYSKSEGMFGPAMGPPGGRPGSGRMPSREEIEKLMKQYGGQGKPPAGE